MTNSKTTKRALFSSVVALLLCFTMLLGTTFAWFTDSASSATNKIVAGNLDVELYHADKAQPTDTAVDSNTKLFDDVTLWEPGAMVWEKLTVKNAGSLALKYNLSVNVTDISSVGGKSLADVLKVAVLTEQPTRDNVASAATQSLATFNLKSDKALTADNSDVVYVAIYWAPSANDNDYNVAGQALYANLGVTLLATQYTSESDSFDNQYDKDATYDGLVADYEVDYEVDDAVELKELLRTDIDGAVVRLKAGTYDTLDFVIDYKYNAKNLTLIGEAGTVLTHLNFAGSDTYKNDVDGLTIKNITFTGDLILGSTEHKNVLVEDCVFNNNAKILQGGGSTEESVTNLTVKNCKFYGSSGEGTISAISLKVVDGLTVSGCTFNNIEVSAILLNTEATGNITIENNTISNCGSRAMRIVTKDGAVLNISDNVMTNSNNANASAEQDRGQVIKITGAVTDGTFVNNTHNGVAINFTDGIAK